MRKFYSSRLLPRFERQFNLNFYNNLILRGKAKEFSKKIGSGSNLVILIGSSGAGRDTVLDELIKINPNRFVRIRRSTSRFNRYQEEDERIISIAKDQFVEQFSRGEMLFAAKYHVNKEFYGISKAELSKLKEKKCIYLIEENLSGLALKKLFPGSKIFFVLPPSLNVLKERLFSRDSKNQETVKRLGNSLREIKVTIECLESFIEKGIAHGVVVNNSASKCAKRLSKYILNKGLNINKIESFSSLSDNLKHIGLLSI